MPENRQAQKLKSGVSSNQSEPNNEEAIQRLKINDNHDIDAIVSSSPYPDRPGEPDCSYYLKTGTCSYGSHCRYNHPAYIPNGVKYGGELPERVGQPDCGYFLKTGTCRYGSTCKYHHPRDRRGAAPLSINSVGLPMRPDEKPCLYYMRTGSCKFGIGCKFHHPQPAGSVLPLASSVIPSSTLPYVGGYPAWSMPRMLYVTGPQGLPVYVSPSQGVLPVQSWNAYMGNLDPASSTSMLGSNLAYNSANTSDPGSTKFPQRPDQPECRHFITTGTCKYGSDCKFNHPKERVAQSLPNSFGFPMRPGQAVCSNFRIYGYCKYGSTCKFDHPMMAHPYNYTLNQLSLSAHDTFLSSHPMDVPTVQSSESFPIKSSKSPELTQKPNFVRDKHQKSDAKATENPSSPPDSPSRTSLIDFSESLHDSSH